MDPNSGIVYSGEAVEAMREQAKREPRDKPMNALVKRLVQLTDAEADEMLSLGVRERQDWARQRNARKRASRERRGAR